jgi:hypothetical protein
MYFQRKNSIKNPPNIDQLIYQHKMNPMPERYDGLPEGFNTGGFWGGLDRQPRSITDEDKKNFNPAFDSIDMVSPMGDKQITIAQQQEMYRPLQIPEFKTLGPRFRTQYENSRN